jgi:hypothetical protein
MSVTKSRMDISKPAPILTGFTFIVLFPWQNDGCRRVLDIKESRVACPVPQTMISLLFAAGRQHIF